VLLLHVAWFVARAAGQTDSDGYANCSPSVAVAFVS
jgi:hypothetical protein